MFYFPEEGAYPWKAFGTLWPDINILNKYHLGISFKLQTTSILQMYNRQSNKYSKFKNWNECDSMKYIISEAKIKMKT